MSDLKPPYVWERHAVIIDPMPSETGWSPHCQMPTPLRMNDGTVRIYYTARCVRNQAHVFHADIEAKPPYRILNRPYVPCLSPGQPGFFDAAGVMPTSVIRMGDEVWLYYIGWTVRADVPYHNAIGLAVSKDGGHTFERRFNGPIVATSVTDPLFCSTAEVHRDNDRWIMWYASTTQWIEMNGKMEPRYNLRIAISNDGLLWHATGDVAVDYKDDDEAAVARATVLRHNEKWHMWFCTRNLEGYRETADAAYRLDYAYSGDGKTWQRASSKQAILTGTFGECINFDNMMQAYPAVIETADGPVLLYNGDRFGSTGIAIAHPISAATA